jgi:hypothetical protein
MNVLTRGAGAGAKPSAERLSDAANKASPMDDNWDF